MAKHFEELEIWQLAKDLCVMVYSRFKDCKDFRFCDQIQSAAVSIMNNIAEGFERKKGSKELERFLYISKGSAGEVRSMLYLALEFKYLSQADHDKLRELCMQVSRILYGFIDSL
ncbi:MAG: four helix bundle protein [Patescibacteria group bacterium]|nr:four helix bundle protein [Patescibacteria group bacterium]MDE1941490.1 four helix bundle protein [Patescibacteria group bacterium]MDE1966612.1 four helix bundle protein [Patescibacteria group bacterium]